MEEKTWNLKDDGFSILGDSKAPLLPPNIQKIFQGLQDCEHNNTDDYELWCKDLSNDSSIFADFFVDVNDLEKDALMRMFELTGSEEICTLNNIPITFDTFNCLKPNTWLNDQIINFYFELLQKEDEELCRINPERKPSLFLNSFFIQKLLGIDHNVFSYNQVMRWFVTTCKERFGEDGFTVFDFEKIFVPVNISNTHWTLLVLYRDLREIKYFDSGLGIKFRPTWNPDLYLKALLKWYSLEARYKLEGEDNGPVKFRMVDWKLTAVTNGLLQPNGSDCGAYVLIHARLILHNLPVCYLKTLHASCTTASVFSELLRNKIAQSILDKKIH
jgi:Ulp1 family protease